VAVFLRKVGAADGGDMHIAEWTTPDGTVPQARDSLRVVPGGPWAAGRNEIRRALTRDTRDMAAHSTARRSAGRPRDTALDAAILRAAARQLAEQGYAGLSLRGVAAAAGTTPPSLRRRFRGKRELVLAAISALRTVPLPQPAGDPRADALALLESLRVSLSRQPGTAIRGALLAEERRHPELLQRFRQRIEEPVRDRLLQALAQGVRDGQLRPDLDLEAAVSLLIGSLYAGRQQPRQISHDWAERILGVMWPPASLREDDPP
jgi:AcrR family transcriptional regulator